MIIYATDERSRREREQLLRRVDSRVQQLIKITDGHSGDACSCSFCFELRDIARRAT